VSGDLSKMNERLKKYLESVERDYETEVRETGEDSPDVRSAIACVEEGRYDRAISAIEGRDDQGIRFILGSGQISISTLIGDYVNGDLDEREVVGRLRDEQRSVKGFLEGRGFCSRTIDVKIERRSDEIKKQQEEYKEVIERVRKLLGK